MAGLILKLKPWEFATIGCRLRQANSDSHRNRLLSEGKKCFTGVCPLQENRAAVIHFRSMATDRRHDADIVIVGAGISGLACARRLQQAGHQVLVVEKSRGVGGRVATRRVGDLRVDHGLRYLEPSEDPEFQGFLQALIDRNLVQYWMDQDHRLIQGSVESFPAPPRYVAPEGMTTIAKFLASGLDIQFNRRVESIHALENGWQLHLATADDPQSPGLELTTNLLGIAIPAPQTANLLRPLIPEGLPTAFFNAVEAVEFLPCLTAMVGFESHAFSESHFPWRAIDTPTHPDLRWIGLDSSKRPGNPAPVLVLQSSPEFATQHLESKNLEPVGREWLAGVAKCLGLKMGSPAWMQIHRWRYGFVARGLSSTHESPYLAEKMPQPLICCGDWCRGKGVSQAFNSGLAAADWIHQQLEGSTLPQLVFS